MANDKETMGSKRGFLLAGKRGFLQASAWVCVAAGIAFSGSVHADSGGATDFPSAGAVSSGGNSGANSGNGNSGSNSIGTTQTAPPGIESPDQSSQPPYVVNSQNGKIYPKINGGIINPSGGQFYPDVGAGYMNPATGQIIPKQ
jgi:hypothetical protein